MYDAYKNAKNKKLFINYYTNVHSFLDKNGYKTNINQKKLGYTSIYKTNPDWIYFNPNKIKIENEIEKFNEFLKISDHTPLFIKFTILP